MPFLTFRTNAKVEQLLGRELITNNYIAIFELIKNSFDANASMVTINFKNLNDFNGDKNSIISNKNTIIEIIDDGYGMSLNDIETKWMEIGTPAKENKNIENSQINNMTNRFLNGEKGIGRFSVDKIGSNLSMKTKHANDEPICLNVNWNDFNDHTKQIEEIECEYEIIDNEKVKNGTSLIISELRDVWIEKDFKNLISSLKKFLSPIENDSENFKIKFKYSTISGSTEEFYIKNDTFDYLDSYIDAYLTTDRKLNYSIYDNSEIVSSQSIENFQFSSFGAAKLRIYYLDTNSKRFFTKRMGLKTSDYGNIKVFKDNFRIMPYGEPENDWLQIDNKHSQGVYRTFGTKDLIGYILLSHNPDHKNQKLKEATDRLGFIEDVNEFKDLKKFIWTVIDCLQEYTFAQLRTKSKQSVVVLKETSNFIDKNIKNNLDLLNDVIEQFIPDDKKQDARSIIGKNYHNINENLDRLNKASKEIQNQIKIYDKITGKENFLFDVLHQIRNKLAVINAKLTELEFELNFYNYDFSLNTVFEAYSSIDNLVNSAIENVNLSKLRKKSINLVEFFTAYKKNNFELFDDEQIQLNIKELNEDLYVSMNLKSLENIFENLTSNSIKAMKKNNENKKIEISISKNEKNIQILFSDNGIGIKDEDKPFIFSLWSSFSEKSGTGIGLYSIKTTLEEISGEINLVTAPHLDMSTTFQILIPTKKRS